MTVQKLKDAVKELTSQERILFVKFILDTIADDTNSSNESESISDEWKEELDKRSKAYKTENISTITWSDLKVKLG